MKLKKMKSDKILSLTAMLISIGTLVVFLYQTNLIRKQQYMSVYPYLSMENFGTNTENYMYVLVNNGIGPAIIKSIEVKTKDGKLFRDIQPYVRANLLKTDTIEYYHTNLSVGMLIPANKELNIIELKDGRIKSARRLYEILNRQGVSITIEYESIYEEEWTITNTSSMPIKK